MAPARTFVVVGHRAVTVPTFDLKDLPGTGGRIDVLVRCATAAFLTSHGLREGVDLYEVLLGPPSAPKALHWTGTQLRRLNPDERSTAALLQKALGTGTTGPVFRTALPGLRVADAGLAELRGALGEARLFVLEEGGPDLATVLPGAGLPAAFFLGDDQGFTAEERAQLAAWGAQPASLGPVSLHADQAIVVAHALLDRAGFPT